MQIDLSSFHRLMPEPERDHRGIDTCLQQFHGRTVPQTVWRDVLLPQRRAALLGDDDVFGEQVLYGIGTEPPSMNVGE